MASQALRRWFRFDQGYFRRAFVRAVLPAAVAFTELRVISPRRRERRCLVADANRGS